MVVSSGNVPEDCYSEMYQYFLRVRRLSSTSMTLSLACNVHNADTESRHFYFVESENLLKGLKI